jgi:hypothetical protein
VDVEFRLRTDEDQQHDGGGQQDEFITQRYGTVAAEEPRQHDQHEQAPGAAGDFDEQAVDVVVPPAAVFPFASEIRLLPEDFQVLLLAVETENVLLRERDRKIAEPGVAKSIPRRAGFVEAGERRADELKVAEPRAEAVESLAEVDEVDGEEEDRGELGKGWSRVER